MATARNQQPGATAVWVFAAKQLKDLKETETILEISERLAQMDAVLLGRVVVQVRLFKEQVQKPVTLPKSLFAISFVTRTPGRIYSFLNEIAVESTSEFDGILSKLKHLYAHRQSVQVAGVEYQFGDFFLRLGSIQLSQAGVKRGFALEVEYRPVSNLELAMPIILELLRAVLPPILYKWATETNPNVAIKQYHLEQIHSHLHTAAQYVVQLQAEELL